MTLPKQSECCTESSYVCTNCGAKYQVSHQPPEPDLAERVTMILRAIGIADHIPAILKMMDRELDFQRLTLINEICTKLEGMKKKIPYEMKSIVDIEAHPREAETYDTDCGYNQALTDALTTIKNL